MPFKAFYRESLQRIRDYNVFIREENDYDDNEDQNDERGIVKEQKYATWFYILLLFSKIFE